MRTAGFYCLLLFLLSAWTQLLAQDTIAVHKSWKELTDRDTLLIDAFKYNSKGNDYSPISLKNGDLFFTSDRDNFQAEDRVLFNNENVYFCQTRNGKLSAPILSGVFNNDDNTALAGFAASQQQVFIYKSFNEGDLYFSSFENDRWTGLKPFKAKVNSDYHEQYATTWYGMMILSSDRPGGKGGQDLWWSKADPMGNFSEFYPLEIMNSSGDELDPSFSSDGKTLYFASDRTSPGSFDIYTSRKDSMGNWSAPEAMDIVNTSADERGFFDADSIFYFCSNRAGGKGGFDIYKGWGMSPKPSVLKQLILAAQQNNQQVDTTFIVEVDTNGIAVNVDTNQKSEFYARVQIGAFYDLNVESFKAVHPSLRDTPLIIEWAPLGQGLIGKFLVDRKFNSLREADMMLNEIKDVHHITDAFIAVYNNKNERVAIYNSITKEFVMLVPGTTPPPVF